MIDTTSPATTDIADDDRLIALLGELSAGPAERAMALRALSSMPSSAWTLERVAGSVGAIAPQAQVEADDELAFLTWNVLSSLVARAQVLTGQKVPFEDELTELLAAQSPEIRGFAATTLAKTESRACAKAIAEAVAIEERWDVAIRGIAALTMASVAIPASVLIQMLDAPTQEAVAFAARALGAAGTLDARPVMLRLLAGGEQLDEATEREVRRGIAWLDGVEAEKLATDLFPDALGLDGEGLVLARGGGRAAGFTLQFEPRTGIVSLDLHLPTPGCEEAVEGLVDAVGALLSDETTAKTRVTQDGQEYALRVAPVLPAVSTLRALVQVVDRLTPACELADRRSVGQGVVISALDGVRDALLELAQRHLDLSARVPSARRARTEDGVRWTLLDAGSAGVDSEGVPRVTWAAALECDQLWASNPAAGVSIVLSWSQETGIDLNAAGCAAIAQTLGWRIGLPLRGRIEAAPPALLVAANVPAGDLHVVLTTDAKALRETLARPGAGTEHERFSDLLDQAESLLVFLGSYDQLVADGEDPAEPLNLAAVPKAAWEPPEIPPAPSIDEAPPTSPHVPTVEALTQEFELPLDDSPTDDFTDLRFLQRPPTPPVFVEGQEPEVDHPTLLVQRIPQPPTGRSEPRVPSPPRRLDPDRPRGPQRPVDPDRPRGPQRPPGPSGGNAPLDDQGRTPSDVVKQLSADLITVDVYLRSAGYNHAKLAQIMTILLGLEPDEARAVIAKAPCRLVSAVPRDRARTIKTVLEGTGAIIAWEDPDGDEEA